MLGLAGLLALGMAGAPPAHAMTFEEAWDALQAYDDSLAAGVSAEERARALFESSKSLQRPQIDLVGSHTRLNQPVEIDALALKPLQGIADTPIGNLLIDLIGGPDAFTTPLTRRSISRATLVGTWPVYTGGRITALREIESLGIEQATVLLEERRRTLFIELVATYFSVVMAEKTLLAQRQAEETMARHLDAAKAMEAQGLISRVERLAVESAHDQTRILAGNVAEKYEIAQHELQRLVHGNQVPIPRTPLFINDRPPAVETLQSGLAYHPASRLLQVQGESARALEKIGQSQYRPDVFLYGGYNLYKEDSLASDLTPDWVLGIGLRMPLVDRSGRSGKIQAARSAAQEAALLRRSVEHELHTALETEYREARLALQDYQLQHSSIELARETLRLREREFAEGLGRSLNVVDAQTQLTQAKTRRDMAAFRYVLSLARMLSLSGEYDRFTSYYASGEKLP